MNDWRGIPTAVRIVLVVVLAVAGLWLLDGLQG